VSFCSRTEVAAQAPPAGTGVRAQAYVFLPVAKRLWGASEMNGAWASAAELSAIADARRGGVVTRLYSPPRQADPAGVPILIHHAPDRPRPPALEPLLAAFGGRWPVEEAPCPRLAVCTHGTRDRCCAKFGFEVFKRASRLFADGRSPFEPLECSHLGGDRFAATGIFFPSGSMYAHLDRVELDDLAAREAAGGIEPEHYRGRVFDAPLTQVVRAGLARDGLLNDGAAPLRVERESPEAMEAVATSADGARFQVRLEMREFSFYASCGKLAQGQAATGRRMVYVAGRVA